MLIVVQTHTHTGTMQYLQTQFRHLERYLNEIKHRDEKENRRKSRISKNKARGLLLLWLLLLFVIIIIIIIVITIII